MGHPAAKRLRWAARWWWLPALKQRHASGPSLAKAPRRHRKRGSSSLWRSVRGRRSLAAAELRRGALA